MVAGFCTHGNYFTNMVGVVVEIDDLLATPDIACTRDRLGNVLSAVAEGVSTNLYAYSREGLLTNEVQNGTTIARNYDAFGRPAGYDIEHCASSIVHYSYDAYGRLSAVEYGFNAEAQRRRVVYGYLPGTDLVAEYSSGDFVRSVSYEPDRNLIASVENSFGDAIVSRFDYTNDALGRRTAIARSGEAFASLSGAVDAYGYNGRSEVTSARRTQGGDEVRGFSFDYAYDPIGNRTSSAEYDENGILRLSLYETNELNEYTKRTVAGHATVLGEADADAEVTVNGRPAWRLGPYFYGGDNVFNATNAVFAELEVEAVRDLGGGTNEVDSAVVRRFVPETPERFTYDADGNLTSDGRWTYTWNGENRLIRAVEVVHPTNRVPRVVEYAYDHRGCMVWKTIGGTNAPPDTALAYVWDDYNIVRETLTTNHWSLVTHNIWGLDLDGTVQGCGGVGGLLAVAKNGGVFMPTYDANGNISEYVSTNGSFVAHREYDPFGNSVVSVGDDSLFTHWFSTKPWCGGAELYEYQFRKYRPEMGGWMSRDQMGEYGGVNLYRFCRNVPLASVDRFGLMASARDIDQRCPTWEERMDYNLHLTKEVSGGAELIKNPSINTIFEILAKKPDGDPLVEVMILSKDLELWTRIATQSEASFLYELLKSIPGDKSILPKDMNDLLNQAFESYIEGKIVKPRIDNIDLTARSQCDAAIRKVNLYAFALKKAAGYYSIVNANDSIFHTRCHCSYRKRSKEYREMKEHWKDVFETLQEQLSLAKNALAMVCPSVRQWGTPGDDEELIPIKKVDAFFENPL